MSKRSIHKGRADSCRPLFEDNPQAMWVVDLETLRILDVNRAALSYYGYERSEFLRLSFRDIAAGPELTFLPQGSPVAIACGHKLKDGRVPDGELLIQTTEYHGRKAALAVVADVARRKLLEDQLRQASKMEAVGMLAGGVAHDFNNLLTIINGYSQLLLATLQPGDRNHEAVEQIMKAGERAAALTHQLLAFSRRQTSRPKVLDLNQLVTGMASMLWRLIGENIDLKLVTATDLGRVTADPGQIEQVIMNLAVNARDAMPKGGRLLIETSNVELDEVYTQQHLVVRPGHYVLLAVSDNGTGMDAETRSHLFEPFFTTKTQGKGTGLGLSTVFGIVKQSDGNVSVYSEVNQGTTVKVYLPRADQPEQAPETPQTRPLAAAGSETILLVEDDEMVRRFVIETLERDGYTVLEAATPEEALRLSAEHAGRIDLLLTDVVMPQMNGKELSDRLTLTRDGMKVLFISGYTDNAVVHQGGLEDNLAFLQKPFTPVSLSRKVRDVLDGEQKKSDGSHA